jgi:Cu/Ag efflux protein CusF
MKAPGLREVVLCGLLLFAIQGCSNPENTRPRWKNDESVRKYPLKGKVVRVTPERQTVTIHHDEEDGMPAMTMEFPVRIANDLRRLHAGDQITATVMVSDQGSWVDEIKVVKKE